MSLKVAPDKKFVQKDIINFSDVKRAAVVIRALNNPVRKRIIEYLLNNETATVTDMVINLREEQTLISQHLNILRSGKIVTFLKKGKNVYYFVDKQRITDILKCLSGLFEDNNSYILKISSSIALLPLIEL